MKINTLTTICFCLFFLSPLWAQKKHSLTFGSFIRYEIPKIADPKGILEQPAIFINYSPSLVYKYLLNDKVSLNGGFNLITITSGERIPLVPFFKSHSISQRQQYINFQNTFDLILFNDQRNQVFVSAGLSIGLTDGNKFNINSYTQDFRTRSNKLLTYEVNPNLISSIWISHLYGFSYLRKLSDSFSIGFQIYRRFGVNNLIKQKYTFYDLDYERVFDEDSFQMNNGDAIEYGINLNYHF